MFNDMPGDRGAQPPVSVDSFGDIANALPASRYVISMCKSVRMYATISDIASAASGKSGARSG
jgi:hypothetical protein